MPSPSYAGVFFSFGDMAPALLTSLGRTGGGGRNGGRSRRLARRCGLLLAGAVGLLAALVLAGASQPGGFALFRPSLDNKWSPVTQRAASSGAAAISVSPSGMLQPQPAWQRLLDNVAATVKFPYRFLRLARITREVVGEVKQKAKEQGTAKSGGSSGGAASTLQSLIPNYMKSHVIARTDPETYRNLLNTSLNIMVDSVTAEKLYDFQPYHQAIRGPEFDYYAWGNDFFRSMVKYRNSRVEGLEYVAQIKEQLERGDNVVLLANHQTEVDPQVLSLLLELHGQEPLAERCIFVAGHKVTTDPLAVPFSMGRNLLTIFSKKYLDTFDEEAREEKSARNRATVVEMQRLLNEGGHILWVAPSGGRDRRSPTSGEFEPAAFDHQSVGLFQVLAKKAERSGRTTHFYPLAMWTHRLVPPPEGTKAAVGESRSAKRAPVGIEFGPEFDVEAIGGRKKLPAVAERTVRESYAHLHSLMRR